MSNSESSDNNRSDVGGAMRAAADLVKAVPVYEDAIQPAAKESGKALQTVGRAVNAALAPVRGLVWGIEQIEAFVKTRVADKLQHVPPERIQTPDLAVAGPALESLRFVGHKDSLSELYANLLASSMDAETARTAHPGFVEIIRNLSSDEAKILKYIYKQVAPVIDIRREQKNGLGGVTTHSLISTVAYDSGCEHRELTATYLTNLERLGLVRLDRDSYLTEKTAYDRILNDAPVKEIVARIDAHDDYDAAITKYFAQITPLGRQFGDACISSKS